MLQVDLRALDRGPVDTTGALAPADPRLTGLDLALDEPVRVTGQLTATGAGRYYWRGELRTRVHSLCRRCLTPVSVAVSAPLSVLFTEDQSADDPSVWVIEPHATELDLRDAVREELILSVPSYVVCREDCRGLCPGCGEDLNVGSCTCRPPEDPRWTPLHALRETLPDDAR